MPITVLENANIFAPEALGVKNLLITDHRITAISEKPFQFSDNIHVDFIDLAGATLTPGFIDSHAHITGGGGEAGFATQVPPVPISEFTSAGVTTVVGLLGTDDTTRTIGNLISRVYGLREEGMTAYCWTGGYHYPLTTLIGSAKQDIVYLEPVLGIGEFAISDHRSSQPTLTEVVRLASEAHVAGLMTGKAGIIHFHLGDGERKLDLIERAIAETEIPARVFNPTHVNRNKPLFDSACALLAKGCYIDITAFPEGYSEPGWSAAQAIALAVERQLPLQRITLSSDGGGCMPHFDKCGTLLKMDFGRAATLQETLQSVIASGVELTQVLPMLTSNVATLLKLTQKGQIRVGADADLLVLDNHHHITDVMAMGRWHKRANKRCILGTFENN